MLPDSIDVVRGLMGVDSLAHLSAALRHEPHARRWFSPEQTARFVLDMYEAHVESITSVLALQTPVLICDANMDMEVEDDARDES